MFEVWKEKISAEAMDEVEQLRAENQLLRKANEDFREEIELLRQEIVALKERLNLNSSNSSRPPSSDGLRKKKTVPNLRSKTGKKSGGQLGHKGNTLEMVEDADDVVVHKVMHCKGCGRDLSDVANETISRRQVFDLPVVKVQVTEHQREHKTCPACRAKTSASFPEHVSAPVCYGPRVKAAAVYLQHGQLIPQDRLAQLFKDVFKLPMSSASVASFGIKLAPQLENWMAFQSKSLLECAVKHVDETGFRISGKTCWLHSIGSKAATIYRPSSKRGEVPCDVRGIVVHDHFKSYYSKVKHAQHALCNAHHLRELKALIDNTQFHEPWANSMHRLLVFLSKLVKKAVPPDIAKRVTKLYEAIVNRGLAYHESLPPLLPKSNRGRAPRRKGHNLLIRLHHYQQDVLRCVHDQRVPFSNNLAERDVRMMKLKQKISLL